ncbi:MAG TPA: HlyD family secretion protein [Rhodothermales bacterium]|nr:HlyD family secretion protein [Rhodothermales bacterium]
MEAPAATEPKTGVRPGAREVHVYNDDGKPGRSRRKILIWIVAVVVAVPLLIWGISKWRYAESHVSTDDAQVEGHIVPVLAKVGGFVKSVSVENNVHVREGALLVQLDDAELRERLAQAEAQMAAAEAVAQGGSKSQVASAFRQNAALEAQIGAARAEAEKADKDLERARELAGQHIISQQQLDAAQAAARSARAGVQALEQQSAAAEATISGAESSVKTAAARLVAAQAAVENAKLQLSYAQITAPAGGIVSKKNVEVGQLVQPGQPLMAIVADTSVWVTANFKETQLAQIEVGQPVEIDVDAYPDCTAHGSVMSIAAATGATFALLPPDNATGNFTKVVQRVPVRIRITDDCGAGKPLRPGFSSVVHVNTGQ